MSAPDMNGDTTSALVRAICARPRFGHPVDEVRLIETHISYVLLTGKFAYKIKKPVALSFVDFSTLEKRRAACEEEMRLNARLAGDLYLGIVPICGSAHSPVVGGRGEAIEYAVKMQQFPDDARLDQVVQCDGLTGAQVRALGVTVAGFHSRIAVAGADAPVQQSDRRYRDIMDNFEALKCITDDPERAEMIEKLRSWSAESLIVNADQLRRRKQEGLVREGHGDMHLANMALLDGEVVIFDALEFNEALRWTDVMSEVAFVVMDFLHHSRPDLASIFLSSYLESTGDYDGLAVLRHFLVYRAMVRAKVSAIRARQETVDHAEARHGAFGTVDEYLKLAEECTYFPPGAFLLITCGPSGSGKSLLSERLIGPLGAVRVRSDIERRRRAQPGEDRYSGFARHRTYGRLEACADKVLAAGFPVIVDATFIRRAYRDRFWRLANEHGVPFAILVLTAPRKVLASRIAAREAENRDPSEATVAVLDRQLEEREPLTPAEQEFAIELESTADVDLTPVEGFLRRIGRLPLEHRLRRYRRPSRECE